MILSNLTPPMFCDCFLFPSTLLFPSSTGTYHQSLHVQEEKQRRAAEGNNSEEAREKKEENKEERVISLRPLNMEDFRQAKNQVIPDTLELCVVLLLEHFEFAYKSWELAGCCKLCIGGVNNGRVKAVE